MSRYDYQELLKREEQITNLLDLIRNFASDISETSYLDKESLTSDDIHNCIDNVWSKILELHTKPSWIVYDAKLKEAISEYVYNFIKHEHDNFVSMGSASTNYWNNMHGARSNLFQLLRNQ